LAIGRAAAQLPFLVIFLAMLAPSCAGNQGWDRHPGPAEVPLGPDNKQLWWVPIDAGSEESLLETTVYRPSGPGPFPLVTINHGKPRPDGTDPSAMRPSFGAAAHWFVDRGFAVAVPMRRGYGLSSGPISNTAGPCSDRDYFATALKTAADMEGVVAYLRKQMFVDRNRVVVVGLSYGGLGALGVAYDKPEGVIGIVNFAGGAGSNRPGEICSGRERLIAAVGRLGEHNLLPQVWLYAENDHYLKRASRLQWSRPIAPARARPSRLLISRRSARTGISPLHAAIPRSGRHRWIVILQAFRSPVPDRSHMASKPLYGEVKNYLGFVFSR